MAAEESLACARRQSLHGNIDCKPCIGVCSGIGGVLDTKIGQNNDGRHSQGRRSKTAVDTLLKKVETAGRKGEWRGTQKIVGEGLRNSKDELGYLLTYQCIL